MSEFNINSFQSLLDENINLIVLKSYVILVFKSDQKVDNDSKLDNFKLET